jgi:acetyltransferase-like isoleucine patch superfamily enzyme
MNEQESKERGVATSGSTTAALSKQDTNLNTSFNALNLFDDKQLAAAESFLKRMMTTDKGGIKNVNEGLAILMRAQDLQIPFSTSIEHIHVINGKTGVDIHPGAKIDEYFFIDHATGIVIGETCEIGKHVKVYQGVTLGALSLGKGQALSGSKRHPTVKDNVTIYSGASIFGGDTVIGKNTTIGSNAFVTESVEDDMIVTIAGQKKKLHSKGGEL